MPDNRQIAKTFLAIIGFYALLSAFMILVVIFNLNSSGALDEYAGNWSGILTSMFAHISTAHLEHNLRGIWQGVALLTLLGTTGMYVYGCPTSRKMALVAIVTPFGAALFGSMIFYSHLTDPTYRYLGASGLAYALEGADLMFGVLYLRVAAKFFYQLPRKARFQKDRKVTVTIFILMMNFVLALVAFANTTDKLWDPIAYFNISQAVGYQIHVLGFLLAALGVAFVMFTTAFDEALGRLKERLLESGPTSTVVDQSEAPRIEQPPTQV